MTLPGYFLAASLWEVSQQSNTVVTAGLGSVLGAQGAGSSLPLGANL